MTTHSVSRRAVLQASGATLAGWLACMARPDFVFPGQAAGDELVPFLNMPRTGPNMLDWETLDSWLTPQDQVFSVSHYDVPEIDAGTFRLEIGGLVERSRTLTLADLRALPRHDQLMTLECSGNGSSKGFIGAVYNSKWTGTRLGPLLKECGIRPSAKEIVFVGADKMQETLRKGTKREVSAEVPFGRSMEIEDALGMDLLLA